MGFKEQIAADVGAVFFNDDEFAGICTYKVFGSGTEIPGVSVIINNTVESRADYGVSDSSIAFLPADAISEPQRNDKIIIGSTVYTVLNRIGKDEGVYTVSIDSGERHNPK